MVVEQILALVTFIVVVLALSLLLPTRSRPSTRPAGGDGGATGAWLSDGGDCSASDSGGCDGGGGD